MHLVGSVQFFHDRFSSPHILARKMSHTPHSMLSRVSRTGGFDTNLSTQPDVSQVSFSLLPSSLDDYSMGGTSVPTQFLEAALLSPTQDSLGASSSPESTINFNRGTLGAYNHDSHFVTAYQQCKNRLTQATDALQRCEAQRKQLFLDHERLKYVLKMLSLCCIP
jgi:hypothetical protein